MNLLAWGLSHRGGTGMLGQKLKVGSMADRSKKIEENFKPRLEKKGKEQFKELRYQFTLLGRE